MKSTIATEILIFMLFFLYECRYLALFTLLGHKDDIREFETSFYHFAPILSLLCTLKYAIS